MGRQWCRRDRNGAESSSGLADDYNLILLDWKMPGMDGIERQPVRYEKSLEMM